MAAEWLSVFVGQKDPIAGHQSRQYNSKHSLLVKKKKKVQSMGHNNKETPTNDKRETKAAWGSIYIHDVIKENGNISLTTCS